MKLFSYAFFFFACVGVAYAQDESKAMEEDNSGVVLLNSRFSYLMLEPNENLRKNEVFLDARKSGLIGDKTLYLGAQIISIMDYQSSNENTKFGYLMRHPTSKNQIGKTVSEAVVHSVQVAAAGSINSWLGFYSELLYNPEQSFGAGTITALSRNQVEMRKAYVMLGDLNKSPVYLAIGKMDAPFGQMNTVSPFTNTTMWHAFAGLGYGALAGVKTGGLSAAAMLVQGGSQFRALHAPVDETNVPSRLNNYVLDLNYTVDATDDLKIKAGISHVRGTAYCQDFPVVHFEPCEKANAATTYYGSIDYGDQLTLKGGFAKTADEWPGTFNPNPPLNEFAASKVSSLDYGAKYRINPDGNIVYALSAEFSNFVAGPEGAPWHRQNQIVIGLSGMVNNSSKLFFEFVKVKGYAPLNFISGGNFPDLGVTHSSNNASSTVFVAGAQLTL